jgi:hypothetical protein
VVVDIVGAQLSAEMCHHNAGCGHHSAAAHHRTSAGEQQRSYSDTAAALTAAEPTAKGVGVHLHVVRRIAVASCKGVVTFLLPAKHTHQLHSNLM